jgi:acetylornithine deacetylase/succinyl-diaminopimelate desuccinylase-like protein
MTDSMELINKFGLKEEIIRHLKNLICINTTNPPGNEIAAARYVAEVFKKADISYNILESEPGRASIIARHKGDGSKRPLLLMSHLDVVGVEADKWARDPFGAEEVGGVVWGRGALDCKNSVALWMAIMIALKRSGILPKRDVIFLSAADEETGGSKGCEWLVKNHFNLIDAEAALNEGGGFGIDFMGKTFYTYQSAEKGNIWLRVTARGTPGHASMPREDNPVKRLACLINKLTHKKYPLKVTPSVKKMIEVMASSRNTAVGTVIKQLMNPIISNTLIRLAIKDAGTAAGFKAMLHNTVCPTVFHAGQKTNVIPSEAVAEFDFRILPPYDPEEFYASAVKEIGPGFEIEVLDKKAGTESPVDHELAHLIRKTMNRHKPDATIVPFLIPGVTDGVFFRPRGMVVYGFTPVLPQDDISLTHGHDERISVESLEFSLKVGLEVVLDFVIK